MRYLLPLLLLPAWLGVMLPVQAEEFKSPKGFSLTCPDGWQVASAEKIKQMREAMKRMGKPDPDFAAIITGPKSDDFTPQVNVIVIPEELVLDAKGEKDYVAGVKNGLGPAGKSLAVKTGHITIGGKKALTTAFELSQPASGKAIRSWIVTLPGKQQVYTISCMASKAQWDDVWEGFHKIATSIKIDRDDHVAKKRPTVPQ
jgi:hypothetical protein